jgi:uncharacterized protein (TIGR02452 family)
VISSRGRERRAKVAAETLDILARGEYVSSSGERVSIASDLATCVDSTQLYTPEGLAGLLAKPPSAGRATKFSVVNATTLSVAYETQSIFGPQKVAMLNFASARNPGGGFQGGSEAQEESLARASGLFASISRVSGYYEANRQHRSALYTDHIIFSPLVPFFRDDAGELLAEPWRASVVSAPAPNAGAVRANEPSAVSRITETMRRRISYVLAVAASQAQSTLVLGAWGCGVFLNDPADVAGLFADALTGEGAFAGTFEEVVFAVLDRRGDVIEPFNERFAS